MPAERTTMRQVREVLRLRTAGVGLNEIARRVGVAPSTVRLTLKRLASAGLSWPLPAEMTDTALETALFAAAGTKQGHRRHVEPDWAEIHRELKRKHVTLTMLWDEYIERCPEWYRYSRFCELYRGWASRLSVAMRQAHIGGDNYFSTKHTFSMITSSSDSLLEGTGFEPSVPLLKALSAVVEGKCRTDKPVGPLSTGRLARRQQLAAGS